MRNLLDQAAVFALLPRLRKSLKAFQDMHASSSANDIAVDITRLLNEIHNLPIAPMQSTNYVDRADVLAIAVDVAKGREALAVYANRLRNLPVVKVPIAELGTIATRDPRFFPAAGDSFAFPTLGVRVHVLSTMFEVLDVDACIVECEVLQTTPDETRFILHAGTTKDLNVSRSCYKLSLQAFRQLVAVALVN